MARKYVLVTNNVLLPEDSNNLIPNVLEPSDFHVLLSFRLPYDTRGQLKIRTSTMCGKHVTSYR